jgi:hypothetical protein
MLRAGSSNSSRRLNVVWDPWVSRSKSKWPRPTNGRSKLLAYMRVMPTTMHHWVDWSMPQKMYQLLEEL